jgi:hypothetical protein
MAHAKSNLAEKGTSRAFAMKGGEFAWDGCSNLTAEDLLGPRDRDGRAPREEAEEFLRDLLLLAGGEEAVKTIKENAKSAGIAWRTVERAKAKLGVRSRRKGGVGESGSWVWVLPRKGDGPLRPPNPPIGEGGGLRNETTGAGVSRDVGKNGGGLSAEYDLGLDSDQPEERPSPEEGIL